MLKEVDEEAHRITTEFKSNKRKASTATDILYGSNKLSTFHGRKFEREISGSNVVEDIGFEKSSFENNLITEENDEFMKDVDMEFKEPPVEDRSGKF